MKQIIFVVEMVRNNDRNQHSYVLGAYEDEIVALEHAWKSMLFRDGKYGAIVTGFEVNTHNNVYTRKLDSWDAFSRSCLDMANKLKELIPELKDIKKSE